MRLCIESELLSLRDKMEIADEHGAVRYRVWSEVMQLPVNETVIEDAAGAEVARIRPEPLSLIHSVNTVTMADGTSFALSREPLAATLRFTIEELGWTLVCKNILLGLDFAIEDAGGATVARVRRRAFSLRGAYDIDIADEADACRVVAIAVVLKRFQDRTQAAAPATA